LLSRLSRSGPCDVAQQLPQIFAVRISREDTLNKPGRFGCLSGADQRHGEALLGRMVIRLNRQDSSKPRRGFS
jgi:hypothetical protein